MFAEKRFEGNGLINLSNFNASAADTIDNAVVTQQDITDFFDNFDYSATPDAQSTQSDLNIADFVTGAGTESNISFLSGYVNIAEPVDFMFSNGNNYSARLELGVDCGELETILDYYNGPGQGNSSPVVTLPAGLHRIRVSSWDYDGANGNVNVETCLLYTSDAADE